MTNLFRPFGPTGKFPYGKLNPSDEGEIAIGVATDSMHNTVIMNFGKRISWLGFPSHIARELGKALIEKADELDRRKI